jgi:hypothetical protein
MGKMRGRTIDVHGAGAQRSDPKTGNTTLGRGPQGDAVRVKNYVRVVRGGDVRQVNASKSVDRSAYPYNVDNLLTQPEGDGQNWGPPRNQTGPQNGGGQMQPPFGGDQIQPQGGGQQQQGNFGSHFVGRLDKDGDGRVSRSEFDGPPDRFDDHDQNGDGYISAQEIGNSPPPPPPGGFGGGR